MNTREMSINYQSARRDALDFLKLCASVGCFESGTLTREELQVIWMDTAAETYVAAMTELPDEPDAPAPGPQAGEQAQTPSVGPRTNRTAAEIGSVDIKWKQGKTIAQLWQEGDKKLFQDALEGRIKSEFLAPRLADYAELMGGIAA